VHMHLGRKTMFLHSSKRWMEKGSHLCKALQRFYWLEGMYVHFLFWNCENWTCVAPSRHTRGFCCRETVRKSPEEDHRQQSQHHEAKSGNWDRWSLKSIIMCILNRHVVSLCLLAGKHQNAWRD
jgi:hypothetical protein